MKEMQRLIQLRLDNYESLFCPRIHKNEFGVENIHLDEIVLSKFCKVIFKERKYSVSYKGKEVKMSNGEAKFLFDHCRRFICNYDN